MCALKSGCLGSSLRAASSRGVVLGGCAFCGQLAEERCRMLALVDWGQLAPAELCSTRKGRLLVVPACVHVSFY